MIYLIHCPLGEKVARDIEWTKGLNEIFISNYANYEGLSWQYFGTAEGIHRQYPGIV